MNQVQTNEEMATRSIMAALSVLGLEDAAEAVFRIATTRKRRDWHNELIRIGFPENVSLDPFIQLMQDYRDATW